MRRLVAVALRLYPKAWRERYGEEFIAMLDARDIGIADVFDILRGALCAQGGSMAFRQALGIGLALTVGMTAGYVARPYVQTSARPQPFANDRIQIEADGAGVRMTVADRVIEAKHLDLLVHDATGLAVAASGSVVDVPGQK